MSKIQGNFKSFYNNFFTKFTAAFLLLMLSLQFTFIPGEISAASTAAQLTLNNKSVATTVSGYTSVSSGKYTFSGSLTYTFTKPVDTSFNKFSVSYYSNQAVKGVIHYTESNRSRSEEFFLEKNTSAGTFKSFTDNYLDGKKATKISKIVFTPLSSTSATIKINSVTTAVSSVYSSDTVYIENDRFKVGCCLIWGGGLNYIEDKKDGDSTIGNMLNKHDTGRLVQQSYYGTTTDSDYECGDYNGTPWGYNPVQGGNMFGEKSKLIDCVVTDTYISVKCRPRDWAREGIYSFAYMENTYTLEKNQITVDNRFIDFSGYAHGTPRHQELPAFYTISYLDTFTFYNGSSPWTDGTLTSKRNLGFWGDQANRAECYSNLKYNNTETWCSWTSKSTGYGIGIYTPGAEILLAGRNAYNGSKSPDNDATNYVAPLKTYTMKNYTPYSYTYYITAGDVSTIRKVFKAQALDLDIEIDTNFSPPKIDYTRITFDDESQLAALSEINDSDISYSNGAVKVVGSANPGNGWSFDMYSYIDYSSNSKTLSTSDYKYLVITYKIPTSNRRSSYTMEIFTCVGDQVNATARKAFTKELIKDGKYHAMVIDLSSYTNLWASGQNINRIRFDFFDEMEGRDVIYISEISLAKTKTEADKYAAASLNTTTATPTPTKKPSTATSKPTPTPTKKPSAVTAKPSTSKPANTTTPVSTKKPAVSIKPVITIKPIITVKPVYTAGQNSTAGSIAPTPTENIYADAEEYKDVIAEISHKGNNAIDDNAKIIVKKVSDSLAIETTLKEIFGTDTNTLVTYMTTDAKVNSTIALSATLPEGYNNSSTYVYKASADGVLTMCNSVFANGKITFPIDTLGKIVFVNIPLETEPTIPSASAPVTSETPIPEITAPQATESETDSEIQVPTATITETETTTETAAADEKTDTTEDNEDEFDRDTKNNNIIILIIIVIALLAIAVIIFLLFKKKNNNKNN